MNAIIFLIVKYGMNDSISELWLHLLLWFIAGRYVLAGKKYQASSSGAPGENPVANPSMRALFTEFSLLGSTKWTIGE